MIINKVDKAVQLGRDNTTLGNFHFYISDDVLCINHDGNLIYKHSWNNDGLDLVSVFNTEYNLSYSHDWRKPLCAIVDFIYNYHTFDLKFKNGKVKHKWINETCVRHNNGNEYPFSDHLINALMNEEETNAEIQIRIRPQKLKNYVTNSNYYHMSSKMADLNGEINYIPRHINLTTLGYVNNEDYGWFSPDIGTVTIDGVSYPSIIAQRKFKICKVCGSRSTKLFSGRCQTCLGVDPELVQIRGYSERAPAFLKFKEGKYSKTLYKQPLFLGVELELESDGNDLDEDVIFTAKTLGTHCIFKRDGSIRNGFEIVSTAATLDIHKEEWRAFFAGVKDNTNLHEHDTVGMHVHVSRSPLSILTVGKMTEFMNNPDNKTYLEKVAGRWSDRFAGQESRSVTFAFRNQGGGERYNALNLRNKETVEFRIFASTRSYEEFIMRLEFCEAVTHYCSPCQSRAKTLKEVPTWYWFADYVFSNAKAWPHLSKFIKGL